MNKEVTHNTIEDLADKIKSVGKNLENAMNKQAGQQFNGNPENDLNNSLTNRIGNEQGPA